MVMGALAGYPRTAALSAEVTIEDHDVGHPFALCRSARGTASCTSPVDAGGKNALAAPLPACSWTIAHSAGACCVRISAKKDQRDRPTGEHQPRAGSGMGCREHSGCDGDRRDPIATRAHRLREVKAPWPTWPVGILATPVSPSPLWRMPWAFALLDIAGVASEVWVEDTTTAQPVSMSRQSPGRFREEEIAASAMTHSSSSGTSFMRRNRPLPSRLESASASRRHTRDW